MIAHAGHHYMGKRSAAPPDADGRAACRQPDIDVTVFFAPEGERPGPAKDQRESTAKAICAGCDLLAACRDWSVDEPYGIYGGLTEDERANERHRRGQTCTQPTAVAA